MPPLPLLAPPASGQMSPDELQRQRQVGLQAAADQYAHEQKQIAVAQRQWQNQRERAHLNLMSQLPKLIGAVVAGAALAYLLPLGDDR